MVELCHNLHHFRDCFRHRILSATLFPGVRADTPFESGYNFLPTIMTQVAFTLLSGRLGKVVALEYCHF